MSRSWYFVPVILGLSTAGLPGCAPDRKSQAVTRCRTEHSGRNDPLVALFGSEGVRELCECAMAAVYSQLPDADRQVATWLDSVGGKVERPGVLGAIRDSTWISSRASEMATFATVYGSAWLKCAQKVTKPPAR